MKTTNLFFWKIFNTLGRIVVFLFLVVGGVIAIAAVGFQLPLRDRLTMILFSCLVALLGVLLLIARPYQPKGRDSQKSE